MRIKRVLIFQQRGWGVKIGHFLAKKLAAEGVSLAAITIKHSTHQYILSQKDVVYQLVINEDGIKNDPAKYLAGESYSLEQICEDLGVDSIWPFVTSLRHQVRSYRDKYYYGFRQNVSDEMIVDYVKAIYKCIKIVFDKFDPQIILTPNFGDLLHIMFNLYARQVGARMLTVTDCKIKGLMIFAEDYNESSGSFYDRVDELNAHGAQSANLDRARAYLENFRKAPRLADMPDLYTAPVLSFKAKLKRDLKPWYQILQWYRRPQTNFLPNLGASIDYRPPHIILRDHYAARKYKKVMDNFKYYPLDHIKKFVYFPLQVQPEVTIDVIAPFFSNQIETARLVAMSLPDDYTLVVKEHPAMVGMRPPSYIEKIARTPNVKLVDYRISGFELIKRADLIVSPNSTSVAEAAFFRIPAIQLGNLGTTLKLPNVFRHTDLTTLTQKIKEVLGVKLDTLEYERRLLNYLAAAYDTGMAENYWGFWERNESIDMETLWQFWKKEIVSLPPYDRSLQREIPRRGKK